MMRVKLDGKKMINKELAHEYIKCKLKIPEYCGKNLDALWDVLSTWDKEIKISFTNLNELIENLGDYGGSIVEVFQDAAEENANIILKLYDID